MALVQLSNLHGGRGCLFFKKTVEGCACIVGATRLRHGGRDLMRTVARLGGSVACDGDARLEQRASVGLVLDRYSYCDGLQALEARGRFEMRALFTAVERC